MATDESNFKHVRIENGQAAPMEQLAKMHKRRFPAEVSVAIADYLEKHKLELRAGNKLPGRE